MLDFDQIFSHFQQYQVIVCQQCTYAVVPSQIRRHLRDHHRLINAVRYSEIIQAFQQKEGVAHSKENIKYPETREGPVLGLPVYQNGFQCKYSECRYICQGLKNIRRHCQNEHDWKNPQKKSSPTKEQKEQAERGKVWREGVSYQRFFEYAQWKQYFEVTIQNEQVGEPDGSELFQQVFDEVREQRREEKKDGRS